MTLSIILPVAYADEVEQTSPYLNGEGFEYIEQDGQWFLNATSEAPVFHLTNVSQTFSRDNLPILIANLDTFEVYTLNLLQVYGYAGSLELKEGYYVITTNNYAWEDEAGIPWVLNSAESFYFYYGDNSAFEQGKYGLTFLTSDDIFSIPLTQNTNDTIPAIKANKTFHFDEEDSIYPLDELHNMDELITRMQHIDLAASLESGEIVYMDGYTPNSTPVEDNNANPNNLGELAAQGGSHIVDTSNTVELPALPDAQPEIITQPQPEESQSQVNTNAANSETGSSLSSANTEPSQSILEKEADEAVHKIYDALGVEEISEENPQKLSIGLVIRNIIMVALLALVVFLYIREKKKNEEKLEETLEYDKYSEGHIE